MGAHSIARTFRGQLTQREIDNWLQNQQHRDRHENGHQSGYSGDWQTVPEVKLHDVEVFNNIDDAYNYAANNSEKWNNGIAVYFKCKPERKSTKQTAIQYEKLNKLKNLIRDFPKSVINRIKLNKSQFITCKTCSSKINRQYIQQGDCLVCGHRLWTNTEIKKFDALRKKYEIEKNKYDAMIAKIDAQLFDHIKINTLIFAWAAS